MGVGASQEVAVVGHPEQGIVELSTRPELRLSVLRAGREEKTTIRAGFSICVNDVVLTASFSTPSAILWIMFSTTFR